MKFKIGDKVRLLGTKSFGLSFNDSQFKYKEGDIFTIHTIFTDNTISFGDIAGGVFKECDLELINDKIEDWSKVLEN